MKSVYKHKRLSLKARALKRYYILDIGSITGSIWSIIYIQYVYERMKGTKFQLIGSYHGCIKII